jgi:RNA polymerase sigma-70 factor (ECF subfamily)
MASPGTSRAAAQASGPAVDQAKLGSEAALLQRLRSGDDSAFQELVERNTGQMLAVARRFMRDEDDARDAVQDAFLSAFRALQSFAGDARLSTWLHRITINACLMKLRTRRRRPEEKIDDLLPGFHDDGRLAHPSDPWPDGADRLLEKEENRELVRSAIDRLPDKYRTVLILRDIEDYDTAETAEALGLTSAGVKTRLHRARLALRGLLDTHFARGTR